MKNADQNGFGSTTLKNVFTKLQGYTLCKILWLGGGGEMVRLGKKSKIRRRKMTIKKGKKALKTHLFGL